ncbi:MAG: succinate dehydrogenase, hydrophobic membrane anchor protein [Alphaproteobacteria bacterium CG1_02_46_17]|nr:MAG: succinate dehydrogenase, hydrophobic membrane anchor protein [Alphaproteobacteria bacterium CG1_02_46_17]
MAQKWEATPFKGDMARARGLGSTHAGVHHWMHQKLTALANIPLVLWAVWSVMSLAAVGADYASVQGFFAQPTHAILMLLFLASVFYHMALGLQVVIEDYVHCEKTKPFFLMGMKLGCAALFVAAAYSVLKLSMAVVVVPAIVVAQP